MRVWHLNCGTLCPLSSRLVHGRGGLFEPGRQVCHCLLVDSDVGLVLVDTGIGLGDLATATERFGRSWMLKARPKLDAAETAARRVEALGFSTSEVRHIVVTHLDGDHAGGLPDFPAATVHVFEPEHRSALSPSTRLDRWRYCPEHWHHQPTWRTYSVSPGESWFGFDSVRALDDATPEILLIPLAGHTPGHCGVAVRTDTGWLLHCGDAYFDRRALGDRDRTPLGLRWFEREVQTDGGQGRANKRRLAALARDHGSEVVLLNSHDAAELDKFLASAAP
jgi:glyoxylase-like metal-dependent hydrolase (beta-lactamase superfamily II)